MQRSVKFAKYLPQFGWKPLVVAHGGMADNVSGVRDDSLLKDLPPGHIVQYTSLLQPEKDSYYRAQKKWRQPLFSTDPMAWWAAPAARMGMDLIREHKASAIFVTMSPFTAASAGIHLKRKTGLPLVLDLRDPWALDETRIYTTRWHARQDWTKMHEAMLEADLVIMNTPEAARAVESEFGSLRREGSVRQKMKARVISITNGYDQEDFGRTAPDSAPSDVFRIVHTGMFHSELAVIWDKVYAGEGFLNQLKYPRRPINLWSRTPRYLLAAMEKLIASGQIPKDKLELVLVGEISANDRQIIEDSPLAGNVKMLGYRSHAESVHWLESADLLFLPLHTPIDGGPALVVPGKAYEYLGSNRPILAMGPPGDMRNFVQQARAGVAINGDDVVGAADALLKFYNKKRTSNNAFDEDRASIAKFERRELTRRLAAELDILTENNKPT